MRKPLKAAVAAITLGATALVTALPAQAQSYRHDRRHHHNDNGDVAGAAIAAGIVGLALGAAIGSSNRNDRYYDNRYYSGRDYRYSQPYRGYARPYAYGYGQQYRTCTARRTVYDHYGRRMVVRERYAC